MTIANKNSKHFTKGRYTIMGNYISSSSSVAKTSSMNTTMSLKDATKMAPNQMGCYQLYKNGRLIYVGKAEDGIRKRFVQYYNGTTDGYTSGAAINMSKDEITVKWKVFDTKEAVRSCEANWINKYKPVWNKQSGWGEKNKLSSSSVAPVVDGVKVMTPELAIADCFGSAIKSSVKGAVGITAGIEVAKSIAHGDDLSTCASNVTSKSTEAAVTATGAAIASELAGFAAVAIGAGPIGMAVASGLAAVTVGTAVGGAVKDKFEDFGYFVGSFFL